MSKLIQSLENLGKGLGLSKNMGGGGHKQCLNLPYLVSTSNTFLIYNSYNFNANLTFAKYKLIV